MSSTIQEPELVRPTLKRKFEADVESNDSRETKKPCELFQITKKREETTTLKTRLDKDDNLVGEQPLKMMRSTKFATPESATLKGSTTETPTASSPIPTLKAADKYGRRQYFDIYDIPRELRNHIYMVSCHKLICISLLPKLILIIH